MGVVRRHTLQDVEHSAGFVDHVINVGRLPTGSDCLMCCNPLCFQVDPFTTTTDQDSCRETACSAIGAPLCPSYERACQLLTIAKLCNAKHRDSSLLCIA